jgi:hypothetical protein
VQLASTAADRLLSGDTAVAAELAACLLKPQRDNLVERPWGGTRLRAFKGLEPEACGAARVVGESFEIAADDGDEEARQHPSTIVLGDGSTITLPALLAVHAEALLGEAFVARYGRRFPLLPKFLDVAELLSVQAHPPGNVEAYVIVETAADATLRLGFAADLIADTFALQLAEGRRDQQRLVELAAAAAPEELQALLKPWLARRDSRARDLKDALTPGLAPGTRWADVERCLAALQRVHWLVLDALNTIRVKAGDVVYNATPPRVVAASGQPPSAEAHALGNPEGRGLLALEIRFPGPTHRLWDNVRFPVRNVDIEGALAALNLRATRPDDFVAARRTVRPGVQRSVDSEYFRLEHLMPVLGPGIDVPAAAPHSLHALAGRVVLVRADGAELGTLERGESALVPARVGAYRIAAVAAAAELVKVELPPYAV